MPTPRPNQRSCFVLWMLAVASTWMACVAAEASDRPNFVFFLVDDLGWGAMSAYGSDYHETPHFDQLCARGMRFSQAYSACTVCSHSRDRTRRSSAERLKTGTITETCGTLEFTWPMMIALTL